MECGTAGGQIVRPHATAVRFHDGTADRQTQTRAALISFTRDTVEFFKNALFFPCGNTGTVIGHGHQQLFSSVAADISIMVPDGVYFTAFSSRLENTRSIIRLSISTRGKSRGSLTLTG